MWALGQPSFPPIGQSPIDSGGLETTFLLSTAAKSIIAFFR